MDFFRLGNSTQPTILAGILLSFVFGPTSAQADSLAQARLLRGMQSALDARDHAIADVSGENARAAGQNALNSVVFAGIGALRETGNGALADRYEGEWNGGFSTYLFENKDLGDHAPLMKWLADFYNKLEERLGSSIPYNGVLGDVYAMNYAIPIVFSPKGDWRTFYGDRDWVEYRKHFIPFANVITFYGVKFACNRFVRNTDLGNQGKKLCVKVSEKLRFLMGRYVAPKISDFVFNRANGIESTLNITSADLGYTDAAQLLADAQSEIQGDLQ